MYYITKSEIIVVCVLAIMFFVQPEKVLAATGNEYFDALITRSDFWKGYSLRPQVGAPITSPYYEKQLDRPMNGGYQNGNSAPIYITYDSTVDAAKVDMPPWPSVSGISLASNINSTDSRIIPSKWASYSIGRQIKIDNEVMTVTAFDPSTVTPRGVTVSRGQYGTTSSLHNIGATLYVSTNSLGNQLRLPLNTADGNTYLFTWDVKFTASFLQTGLAGNKTFQFTSGGDSIWLEVKTRMDGGTEVSRPPQFDKTQNVGGIDVRSYNLPGGNTDWNLTDGRYLGPTVTKNTPIEPQVGTFALFPNRWTRYWLRIEQRVNDYDYFDLWVADELQNPVLLYNRIPVSVRPMDFSINKFWLEYNDSQEYLPLGRTTDFRSLTSFVRNFAALKNPGDVSALLLRPVSGGVSPPPSITPVLGDINLDHIVNAIDYSILNSKWFTTDTNSDLNKDGIVNAIDYSMLNANWFKIW